MQPGATFVANQTVTPEAQDNQPQIVMPLDSRETDDPPPSYEDVASGYQTMLFDLSRSYSSVTMQAGRMASLNSKLSLQGHTKNNPK